MTMSRLVTDLLLRRPYYGYILSSLRPRETKGLGGLQAAFDGPTVRLSYDPDWLAEQEEPLAYGAMIHELLHIVLMHSQRRSGRSRPLWWMACDLAVNEHIEPVMLAGDALTVDRLNEEPGFSLEKGRTAESYYRALEALIPEGSLSYSRGDHDVTVRLPDDTFLSVGELEDADSSEVNNRTLKCTLEDLSRQAAAEGEIPGSLQEALNGVYRSLGVNWRNILKKFLSGKGRMNLRKTVKRVSRRFEGLPGTKRSKGLRALAAIDESGSIGDDDIRAFCDELRRLERSIPADIMVTRFDTGCTPPVSLARFNRIRGRAKSGGTDFRPVFELADALGVSLVMVFTDGDGRYPAEARQKVLWLLTSDPRTSPPFGDVLKFSS